MQDHKLGNFSLQCATKLLKIGLFDNFTHRGYSTAMAQHLAQGPAGQPTEDPPPWFGPAVQVALAPLRHEVQKFARMTAILYNESQTSGRLERFEVVYFPNMEDPTADPHNLPPLTSRLSILGLTEAQKVAYCTGYYPDIRVERANYERLIYTAIGVRMPI